MEKAASIGAENSESTNQIRNCYQDVLTIIFKRLRGNPEATKALRTAEETRWSSSTFTLNPRIKQLLRMGDSADIIPALLSEDIETIRLMTNSFDARIMANNRAVVLKIASELKSAQELLLRQPEKLEAFGMSVRDLETAALA